MAAGDTSKDDDILIYDPSVDIWSSLLLPSSPINGSSLQSWRPCRAAVHKSLVYLIGNRQSTYFPISNHQTLITETTNYPMRFTSLI